MSSALQHSELVTLPFISFCSCCMRHLGRGLRAVPDTQVLHRVHSAPLFEAPMATAVGSDREDALVEAFHELTNNQHVEPTTIPVQMGRKLQIDKAGLF